MNEVVPERHLRGRPAPIEAVNDFVVKFANVNGSGSASANAMFAKAILRMGVPVAARNIFPSNIQGLPTWYEVRVCEAGHLHSPRRSEVIEQRSLACRANAGDLVKFAVHQRF